MRAYAEALVVGTAVGIAYGMLNFRSPAPPLIALIGLLGMLLGEQATGLVRGWLWPAPVAATAASDPPPPERGPQ